MTVTRRISITRLINRLHELPLDEVRTGMEGQLEILAQTVDAEAFAVLRVDRENGNARILGGHALHTPADQWSRALDTPRLTHFLAGGLKAPALAVEGPFADDPFLVAEKVASMLVKPSHAGELCLVTAALSQSRKLFTGSEIERFGAVAGLINLMVMCCHLPGEQKALAGSDEAIGLGGYSEFYKNMIKEISRARRNGANVTMAIMSVVPPGNASSDDILAHVARSFQDQLRDFDTLVRYGSMQLAFILPDLKSAEGVRVVDRVRRELITSLGGGADTPGIYIGLSCYPQDGVTVERLIEMAEAAMNRAVEDSSPGVYRWGE